MKKMNRIRAAALALSLLLALVAVAGCTPKTAYRTDVAAKDAAEAMVAAIGTSEDYMASDADYMDFYFGEHSAYGKVTDCLMLSSRAETDVNELGVFRAASVSDAKDVAEMVQGYLDDQVENLRSFAANYSPADMGKLDNASVETYGNYVVYYILSAEDETAAIAALETVLAKES